MNPLHTSAKLPTDVPALVEHLEVPEQRVVQGHDMTFLAPVFGQVISDGGLILLQNSLGWGSVNNPGGHIQSSGRCFNATLQAPGGVVQLASAENCLVIGRKVIIHEAVKCQIFAHSVQLGTAAACMIAGRDISIQASKAYKHEPSVITMVVPELSALDHEIEDHETGMAGMRASVDALGARIQAFKANDDLANYLSIRAKLRAGMLTLSDEQNQVFLKMGERLGDATTALETAVAERNPLVKGLNSCMARVQTLREEQAARLAACFCKIKRVEGETIVRKLLETHDDADLSMIDLPKIPKILFRNDASLHFLCAVHEGTVNWCAGQGR